MLPLDHFTLGQVNFIVSFGPLNGDTRQLRYMNLETGNAITIWNLEYGITAQVVSKTLDLKGFRENDWGVKNRGSREDSSMKNFFFGEC